MKRKKYKTVSLSQQGFTLLELLVVVSILAAIAGIGVSSVGGYLERAREDLVHTEMKNISEAIVNFTNDTGYFPGEGVFKQENSSTAEKADFSFLFYSPRKEGVDEETAGEEIMPWSFDENRGWNGPYLTFDSIDYMRSKDCNKNQFNDELRVFGVNAKQRENSNTTIALEDPFSSKPKADHDQNICFVEKAKDEKTPWQTRDYSGKPYLYETVFKNDRYLECPETGRGCIALLSAGKNGIFENGSNDDLVKILRIN